MVGGSVTVLLMSLSGLNGETNGFLAGVGIKYNQFVPAVSTNQCC